MIGSESRLTSFHCSIVVPHGFDQVFESRFCERMVDNHNCLVWLASAPDGCFRFRSAKEGGPYRFRHTLEPADWFCQLLERCGGEGFHKEVLHAFAGRSSTSSESDGVQVCALLRISNAGCVYEAGPLTQWSQESDLLRAFFQFPLDSYDVVAEKIWVCKSPMFLTHKKVRQFGAGGIGKITKTQPLFVAHWGSDGNASDLLLESETGQVLEAGRVLAGLQDSRAAADLPMITMPWPVVFLLTKRAWSKIILLVRWHAALNQHNRRGRWQWTGLLEGWPPQHANVWAQRGQHQPNDGRPEQHLQALDADTLQKFAGIIRSWAPALLEGAQPPASARDDLGFVVTTLDNWSLSWRETLGMLNIPGACARFRHHSHKLLDCIRISSFLTGGPSTLVDVLAQALAITLPPFLREPFIKNITRSSREANSIVPSASLIQRYEIALDVALMLYCRGKAATKCVRVGWADSSPLAGFDWIWSQYHEVPVSHLVRVHKAVCSLQKVISRFAQDFAEEEDDAQWLAAPLPEWVPHLKVLQKHIFEHVNPPAAMGSGRRSLADKAASEVYKWHLQHAETTSLSEHADSFVAFCSDMGVELSLPDFHVPGSVDALLPDWLERKPPAEIDEQLQAPSQHDDVDGPMLVDDDDDDDDDEGGALGGAVVAREAAEAVGASFFMPHALTVAGLQHVVNNLCAEVHQGLNHWSAFHAELKALESLLRVQERRQRFVWTCLHGTQLEAQTFRFDKFQGSLYETRWHEVLGFLRHLKPLLPVLSRAWDSAKYIRGVNLEGFARPVQARAEQAQNEQQGLAAFDPEKITRALQSPLFHCYVSMALGLEQVPEALASAAEGCPCHRAMFKHVSDHIRQKILEKRFRPGITVCPMAGKLLPELVAGELESVFERICALQESELTLMPLHGLRPLTSDEWNLLVSDFRAGHLHASSSLCHLTSQAFEQSVLFFGGSFDLRLHVQDVTLTPLRQVQDVAASSNEDWVSPESTLGLFRSCPHG